MEKEDFYDHYNLVDDEDIEKAKKKPKSKKKVEISKMKKGSTYESVSINKEVRKEDIIKEEIEDTPSEEFLVEYNIVEEQKEEKEKVKAPVYIGFTPRLIICGILVPILSVISIILLYKSFGVDEIENIRYSEKSIINHNFYGTDNNIYLGENNKFDRNLINTIKLDFNYQLLLNQNSNIRVDYKIIEELLIVDKNNKDDVFYSESNELISKENEEINNNEKYSLREEVVINYSDYYKKVHELTKNYREESNSYLNIKLLVNYKSKNNNTYKLKDKSVTSIKIPLSKQYVELEKQEVDIEKRVNKRPTVFIKSVGFLGLGILSSICAIIALSQVILYIYSVSEQYSKYDKLVHKILTKYKKRIIKKDKVPRKTGKRVTNVDNIKTLNKISKKEKVPIEYCIINDHNKCQFSVLYEKELYIYVIKAVDLEKKD